MSQLPLRHSVRNLLSSGAVGYGHRMIIAILGWLVFADPAMAQWVLFAAWIAGRLP